MKEFGNFTKTDRYVLGSAVLVLLLLSYLLYDDSLLFPKDTHGDQKPIGSISNLENDVRRKSNNNFIWLPGNKKDEVYNRDSIFTGDRSEALISLNDGSTIQIQENSLVNLNMADGQMQLDLRFGQLAGSVTPLRIKSGNEEYVLEGTGSKFEINRTATGTLDVKVLSGDMQINGKNGKQSIKANESLKISDAGAEKSQIDASIQLLTKDDIYVYRKKDQDAFPLSWQGRGPITQYKIEVSKTDDFKKFFVDRATFDQKTKINASLSEGTYYWRVKGLSRTRKNIAQSPTHKFYLSYLPAPEVLTPKDKDIVKASVLPTSMGTKLPTKVSWQGTQRHKNFEWQISSRADFGEIVEQKTLAGTQIVTAPLTAGTYYTRVRGFDNEKRPSPWSAPHSFEYALEAEEKPPAPKLAQKRIRFQSPKLENRAPSAETSPQMAWSQVDVAKDYRWELSNSPKFTGAQKTDTPNTKIAWTQYKPGKYYYRVFTRTELGQFSDPSEVGVLEVLSDRPVLDAIPAVVIKETDVDAQPSPKEVRVKWSAVPEAKSYVVEVAKDAEFKTPLQVEATDTSGAVTLPEPGKYFVRVKALNDAAIEITDYSNVQDANYVFKVTLKAPQLTEPYDKSTVFLQKDMEPFVWLEWNSVPRAQKYVLEAAKTPDFASPFLAKELNDTRFLIKEKIPYGKVFWRVRAVAADENQSSDWSARQFILYHQSNQGF